MHKINIGKYIRLKELILDLLSSLFVVKFWMFVNKKLPKELQLFNGTTMEVRTKSGSSGQYD
jgi:hypothetical protein